MSTIISTQFQLAQAVISNGLVTGNDWSNPNNLLLTDGDVSESNPGIGTASDVIIGNFNANVPSNATILGIELEIFAYGGSQTSPALTLTPTAVDNTSGENVFYPYVTPITGLTGTLTTYVLGTPTYLFGTTWTPDMINNFKLQLNANGDIYVDSALLKVYYSVPSPVVPAIGTGGDPIQAQPFYLALDFNTGDRYCYLESFDYVDGTPIQYADLGGGGVVNLTFDPGLAPNPDGTGNFEENCATAAWIIMSNGTVQLDFGASLTGRGLLYKSPYESTPSLISAHTAGAKVIISNNAPFMGQFLQTGNKGILYNGPVAVEDEGTTLQTETTSLNFVGPGVTATVDGDGNVTVTIPGGSGGASTAAPLLVDYATAAILPNTPVYNNGTAGVGATLTSATNTALVVDGVTMTVNGKLILVKNQASAFQNGVYVVTTYGTGSVPWVLTRVSNYNTIGQINYSGPVAVLSGSTNSLTGWALTTNTVANIGTNSISYTQYQVNTSFVTLTGVQTLTNKTIQKRFVSTTQSATPAIDTDNGDIFSIVGLAEPVTSFTTNLTGTPYAGQLVQIQITDNGTAQSLTWGAKFASTTISLPATTVAGILLRVLLQWDTVSGLFDCIAVA